MWFGTPCSTGSGIREMFSPVQVSTVAHWVMSVSDIEAMKSGSGSKAPS